jgi:hypothetical protein
MLVIKRTGGEESLTNGLISGGERCRLPRVFFYNTAKYFFTANILCIMVLGVAETSTEKQNKIWLFLESPLYMVTLSCNTNWLEKYKFLVRNPSKNKTCFDDESCLDNRGE